MSGAGSLDWYDGSDLSRAGDIVVVGINYRLGACGFLSRPGLSDGNAGLLDQRAALLWIAEHIAAFGGDPRRVTLVGQSAGGGSIAFLLTQPSARDLFQRAILQSPALAPPISAPEAAARAGRFLELLGIEATAPDAAARARAVPAARLLEAQGTLVRALASEDNLRLPFGPVAPEPMRPDDYLHAVAEGAKGKEILIGCTREEMHAFFAVDPAMATLDGDPAAARARMMTGDDKSLDAYRERRPGGSLLDAVADLTTDHRFILPSQNLAAAIARRGGKVWTYRFDWSPPDPTFKAYHCIEIPFVFGNFAAWRDAPMLADGDRGEMERLSLAMQRPWITFVRDGDPGHAGVPSWLRQEGNRPTVLYFDRALHAAKGDVYRRRGFRLGRRCR